MKLSICMIVKNEEKKLFSLLLYLKSFVDEINVVDTGSTDSTKSIIRYFADHYSFLETFKDFSSARNESLKLATGEWILILDADEMILRDDYLNLKSYLVACMPVAARIIRYNYIGDGKWSVSNIIRVIKNDPSIYFSRKVHESVRASLNGYEPDMSGAILHHLPNNIGKNSVYTDLLTAYLTRNTMDIHAQEHLAGEFAAVGKYKEAINLYKTVIEKNNKLFRGYINFCYVLIKNGNFSEAQSYLTELWERTSQEQDSITKGEVLNCLCISYCGLLNFDKAYECICESLLYSQFSHQYVNRAQMSYELGNLSEAKEWLQKAIHKNPYLLCADIYAHRDDMEQSIYKLDERNIISPNKLLENIGGL